MLGLLLLSSKVKLARNIILIPNDEEFDKYALNNFFIQGLKRVILSKFHCLMTKNFEKFRKKPRLNSNKNEKMLVIVRRRDLPKSIAN